MKTWVYVKIGKSSQMVLFSFCKRIGMLQQRLLSYNRPCKFISTFIGDMTEQKKYQKKLFCAKKWESK